jgi:hypothetical protein
MKSSDSKIVSDGARRLREAKDYLALRKRLRAEVAQRYADELERAPFWRRLWLEMRIRREVSAELEKEFPPAALHIVAAK